MTLISKNVRYEKVLRISSWRKVAIGTWRTAGDPSVYGMVEVEVDRVLAYLQKLRESSGQKLTLTHFIGKALANTIAQHPHINCVLRFGRLYRRKSVDVFFQVASDMKGDDLSGMTIRNVDQKPLVDMAVEMHQRVHKIRHEGDQDYKKVKQTIGWIPGFFARFLIDFTSFLQYTLNIWSPLLGSPRDPFGSLMITNIGTLGLDSAFAPLVPYSRVPLLVAVGAVAERPVYKNGNLVKASVCRICATFDHRVIDGVHASHMVQTFKKYFENPDLVETSAPACDPNRLVPAN